MKKSNSKKTKSAPSNGKGPAQGSSPARRGGSQPSSSRQDDDSSDSRQSGGGRGNASNSNRAMSYTEK